MEIEAKDFSENVTTQTYEVTVAASDTAGFEYDANGNTTSRTTTTGITKYEWDALDRLTVIDHEDDTRSEFQYDGLSRRVRIIEKDALATIFSDKRFFPRIGLQPQGLNYLKALGFDESIYTTRPTGQNPPTSVTESSRISLENHVSWARDVCYTDML